MNSFSSNAPIPRRTAIMLTIASAMAACNGGDGSGPSISSNPTLVGGDSPTLATAPRNFTGNFNDTARGLHFEIAFASGLPPAGDDKIVFTGDDNVSSYVASPLFISNPGGSANVGDEQSRQIITFVAPGDDGAWYTADDAPGSYVNDTWASLGDGRTLSKQISYTGAGDDGTWFTADDVISQYSQHDYPISISTLTFDATSVTYSGPGGDGVWFTADDFVETMYRESNADSTFSVAGPDGVAGNDDDTLCTTDRTTFSEVVDNAGAKVTVSNDDRIVLNSDAAGCPTWFLQIADWYRGPSAPYRTALTLTDNKSHSVVYDNAGPDAQWRTADDVINARFEGFYFTGLNAPPRAQSRFSFWDNAGTDGQWFTDDDHIARMRIENDPQWLATSSRDAQSYIELVGPGEDETWLTADDIVEAASYSTGGFFGAQDRVSISYRDIGADRKLGTSDDNVKDYSVQACVPQSDDVGLVESFSITGPGPDNIWFTGDDFVASYNGRFWKAPETGGTSTEFCTTFAN